MTAKKIEKLEELIKDSIGGELLEQTVESLLPPGENYGSVMYRVDFKVRNTKGIKEYHAVAKCTPLNELTQEMFNIQETFKSEIAWYTTVIPTMKQFAKEQGLKRDLDFFQEFYGARISLDPDSDKVDLDGVILTENLKYKGYSNVDRHQGFDAAATFSVLKDLATFHAVPLAIKLVNPVLFEIKLEPFCPVFGAGEGEKKENLDKFLLNSVEPMEEIRPYLDRVKRSIRESFPYVRQPLREPWVTITHLDFWCNNVMITSGQPQKNIILDLQVPMIGSPARDLVFFLVTSVNFQAIKSKFDEFVRFYYDEFIKNLKELKVNTTPFTFESFLEEIDHAARTTEYTHSLGHVQFILMEKGESHLDSSDANFKPEDQKIDVKANARQIEKTVWLTKEAVKRNWI